FALHLGQMESVTLGRPRGGRDRSKLFGIGPEAHGGVGGLANGVTRLIGFVSLQAKAVRPVGIGLARHLFGCVWAAGICLSSSEVCWPAPSTPTSGKHSSPSLGCQINKESST